MIFDRKYTGDKRTARQIIADDKKGTIRSVFPSEWLDSTYDEIADAARKGDRKARTAKKLLDDKRFDKGDNRK